MMQAKRAVRGAYPGFARGLAGAAPGGGGHGLSKSFWMPFSSNKGFLKSPMLLESAKGMWYKSVDGEEILDACSGLWCSNAGHGDDRIVGAIMEQMGKLDYAPNFVFGHPKAFEAADRMLDLVPGTGLDHIFFSNCGSTAVDTALKMALAYHKARGEGGRHRFVGRERGYHGVGFGGISVGGLPLNRATFSPALLPGVDHLPATHTVSTLPHTAFSRGQPKWGGHLADELERIVGLHGPGTIAAVIVEPVAGSAGVLPPPVGYLERLRELCTKHGILLIFDEVITGFGRLGSAFGTTKFGVSPDMITCAKGMTSGVIPTGAVYVSGKIHDTIFDAAAEGAIEFPHGYTYSGHPAAMAGTIATLDVYRDDGLFERAAALGPVLEDGLHELRAEFCSPDLDNPAPGHLIDVRSCGFMAALEFKSDPAAVGAIGRRLAHDLFHAGLLVRVTGDTIALAPPLIATNDDVAYILSKLRDGIKLLQDK